MPPDRLAEGLAGLRVLDGFVQRRLRDADAARRDVDAAQLEAAHDLLEAVPFLLAEQVFRRNAVVVENHFARVETAIAELGNVAAHGESGSAIFLDDEQADPAVPRLRVRIRLGENEKGVA